MGVLDSLSPGGSDREKSDLVSVSTEPSTRVPSVSPSEHRHEEDEENSDKQDHYDEKAELDQSSNAEEYQTGFSLACIITALVLSIFLASLDMTIVATAIPKITDEFGGLDKVSWYGSSFFMTNGGFQSSWGKGYKYFPLKPTFLASVIIFEIGSLICGVAPNSKTLIVGRSITGVGAAGIGTGVYTILAFVTEPRKRPMYTGFVGVSFGVASVLGPLLGGVFTDKVSWRWCFYINLPVGGISALIIVFLFHAPSGAKPVDATWREKFLQMDFLGVFMMIGGIIAYTLALEYGGSTKPWNSSTVIGLLVGCVAIFVVFGFWERFQGERAMIIPRLVKNRIFGLGALYTIFIAGGYYLVIYYLPIYFQSVHDASPTMSGVYNLPLIIAVTIAMVSSGFFLSWTGLTAPTQLGGAVFAIVGAGLLYTFDLDTSMGRWIGYQIICGLGWGAAFQVPLIVCQGNARPEDLSSVTALILFCMNFGGTCLITAAQSIFVNELRGTLPTTAPGVDPAVVVATGATQIRSAFPPEQVPGIVAAYMGGIKDAFVLVVAAIGVALIMCAFSKWERLKSATREKTTTGIVA